MEYPGVLKKEHVEIPGLFVYDLGITKGGGGGNESDVSNGISKECLTILLYFQG